MTLTRGDMLASGRALVERFCLANDLLLPRVDVVAKADWRFDSTCAYYRAGVITICPDRCALVGHAARAWSYPGYVSDRTPHGVMAHELGHHADRERSLNKGAYGGEFSGWMRLTANEPKLTSYCPNDWEWFAEMFRLFATNPDLLRLVRPRTYERMCDYFQPVEKRPWREVLVGAPLRTIDQAAKKAGES